MLIFAHIFIGKEFTDLVSGIGRATLKYGGSMASTNTNYMVVDNCKGVLKFNRLKVENSAPNDALIGADHYTKISWEETPTISLSDFGKKWREIYNELLDAKDNATRLYVMIHFPLYKASSVETFQHLYKGISSANLPTQLDFIGYSTDMASIVEPNINNAEEATKHIVTYAKFRKEVQMPISQHLIVIQNTNRYGISLKLTSDSLVEVITHFALACSSNYDTLLPPNLDYKDVVSFGLSSLQVDKFLMADYLLHRAMLNAMDVASINQNEVSASYANEVAESLLKGKPQLLSKFFAEGENSAEQQFSQVQTRFQNEAKEILKHCEDVLHSEKNIPVKTAILAALLSKTDCELFSQSVYNRDGICIHDLFSEGLDYFIENDYGGYYEVDGKKPTNPIPELKQVNAQIIDLETQMRSFSDQLALLAQQIKGSQEVQHCHIDNGIFHFNNQEFRLMPNLEQQLLDETFQPKIDTYIPESIDLRKGFRPIQNQGSQGSCLAHALTAVFEYAMKMNSNEELDLSEAFLYYNARKMDTTGDVSTNIDNGSRIKPAIESLGKYGLAQEKYCRYKENDYTSKPSEEAYTDAAKRKLLKALNVDRSTTGVKTALSEGYPVTIILSLCESFAKASLDGYVAMPTQEEIESLSITQDKEQLKHSSHAMVVVGYSDKLRRFILRNSWGEDWGEDGYCYVPYEYVDNDKLCVSATILTEIDSLSQIKMIDIPTVSVNDQDLNIRYYIVQAMRDKVAADLIDFQRRRQQLFFMCTELTTRFSSLPHTREEYIRVAEEALTTQIDEMRQRSREIEAELESLNKNIRQYNLRVLLKLAGVALSTGAACFGSNWIFGFVFWWIPWVVIMCGHIIWESYKAHQIWKTYREAKHKLEDELSNLQTDIKKLEKIKGKLKYKTHAAYHLLQMMDGVRSRLEDKYLNFLKLLNNLRAWYKEIELSKTNIELSRPIPIFSLLNKQLLDKFFEESLSHDSSCEIDFSAAVKQQAMTDDDLSALRQSLIDITMHNLYNHYDVSRFNITDHIAHNPVSWVIPVNGDLSNECARQADLFIHFSAQATPDIVCSEYILSHHASDCAIQLSEKFRHLTRVCNTDDQYHMTYITITTLKFSDCEALK